MWRERILFICTLVLVTCDDRNEEREERSGKPRLFTFNTVDDDIRVDLEFTIPFITIPAKKAVNTINGMWSGVPSVNINPATLAVGGAIVLSTTVLLPFALKHFADNNPQQRYSKLLDNAQFSTDAFLDFASQMLVDSRSVRGCTLRVACWTAQRSQTESLRVWHQVMSNNLLSSVINATAIEDAMLAGKSGRDCGTYSPCPLREQHIPLLLNGLTMFTNSIKNEL